MQDGWNRRKLGRTSRYEKQPSACWLKQLDINIKISWSRGWSLYIHACLDMNMHRELKWRYIVERIIKGKALIQRNYSGLDKELFYSRGNSSKF